MNESSQGAGSQASWPDRRVLDLFGIELPILQAPMAGASDARLAIAVARAGGLGSIPTALMDVERARSEVAAFRAAVAAPLNLNFFAHSPPAADAERERRWRERLAPYYAELGLEPPGPAAGPGRAPFDAAWAAFVEDVRPEVVSFHFGLPAPDLLARVSATGAKVIGSATTVAEARWLEANGCDAVIAQGWEAGGHRGVFLGQEMLSQPGLFALTPQIVDAVRVPVIAAGGVADGRGLLAALTLGAGAVQVGTAYLQCPEAAIGPQHRAALAAAEPDDTAVTNVFTGRPARGLRNRFVRELGPLNPETPPFPLAALPAAPLRVAAEARGSTDFTPLWAGQAIAIRHALGAEALTKGLAADALTRLSRLAAGAGPS